MREFNQDLSMNINARIVTITLKFNGKMWSLAKKVCAD